MNRFLKVTALILCVTLMLSLPAVAKTKELNPAEKIFTDEELDARAELIHSIISDMNEGKITHEKALKDLEKSKVHPIKHKNVRLNNTNNSDEIVILSNPDFAVNLHTPIAYYDSQTGYYYTTAQFFWNGTSYWQSDFPSPWPVGEGIGVEIGGNDGFGIYFSRPINRHTSFFDTYDNEGNRTRYTYPSKVSSYGEAWAKQDTGFKMSDGYLYDWHQGNLGTYWKPQEPGKELVIHSTLSHTWSTNSVMVTGVSYWGVSWDYDTSSYGWDVVSEYGASITP